MKSAGILRTSRNTGIKHRKITKTYREKGYSAELAAGWGSLKNRKASSIQGAQEREILEKAVNTIISALL